MLPHEQPSKEDNELMKKIKAPLWLASSIARDLNLPEDDDVLWAITINPPPTKLMNKRPYAKYTLYDQQKILSRIENRIRRDNPRIQLVRIYYEVCPTLKQMHFHAMYRMPSIFSSTLETYFHRIFYDKTARKEWRYMRLEPVYNEQGWIKYISKGNNDIDYN